MVWMFPDSFRDSLYLFNKRHAVTKKSTDMESQAIILEQLTFFLSDSRKQAANGTAVRVQHPYACLK